ncbi:MAG: hypothetical protein OXN97_08900 [Bryobacterales bacterium]|nr:hypothetical protein [Bryobacterales bacterium]MDE0625460.1 hypothetical protein [Bryobacterales bacterium]
MSPELIGILAVGVALAGLVLTVGGMAVAALRAMRGELRGELRELGARVGTLDIRLGALEQRMARLEGLLEGAGLYRPAAVPEPMGD